MCTCCGLRIAYVEYSPFAKDFVDVMLCALIVDCILHMLSTHLLLRILLTACTRPTLRGIITFCPVWPPAATRPSPKWGGGRRERRFGNRA